jgi:DNA-binding GntR family transcriptional regulator
MSDEQIAEMRESWESFLEPMDGPTADQAKAWMIANANEAVHSAIVDAVGNRHLSSTIQ